jgi:hypothetical protein
VPHLLGASFETLPVPVPYLRAPVRDAAAWRERLVPVEGSRVGLVWTGSLKNQPGRYRTCPPESFRVLAGLPGVTFYSLQKDLPEGAAPPPLRMLDFTSELADFAATAALMENLDLIVTVDTAVAHLAGALGRPVWLMLPYERDWRWLAHGETSPWYPTMRLFPQEGRGDWDGVLARVADAMGAFQVKGAK